MIRVMIVDDIADTRTSLARILGYSDDIEVVAQAADGLAALADQQTVQAEVIVMDVRMPRMDGIEATRRLLATDSKVKVLVLTTFDLDEYAFAALEAGASGFLLKDTRPAQLTDAVRSVARGDAVLTPRITRQLLARSPLRKVDEQQARERREAAEKLAVLTEREREVVDLIADGLTNAEIAEKLVLSTETTKTYVKRLLTKLGLRDRIQIVLLVHAAEGRAG
ncbi:hypothetical protein HMPREF1531_00777 [Propionibacterium sp. oral taxon 192 str. F0372]|uniref:response regulator n=1 Tax=Propionibacterium sp. oral taxon 192 TaxID=671222 RepID=UPI0003533175|nr:response regulator transcription factor [Propionibacterium sp. oral taxon 192]EPH06128.1 hypothetical protein HMPREF1531_00777 [Propionibacterium sp. oral taxon 192 str. F0372]